MNPWKSFKSGKIHEVRDVAAQLVTAARYFPTTETQVTRHWPNRDQEIQSQENLPRTGSGLDFCCSTASTAAYYCPMEPLGPPLATERWCRCSTIARKRKAAGFRNTRTQFQRQIENRTWGEIMFHSWNNWNKKLPKILKHFEEKSREKSYQMIQHQVELCCPPKASQLHWPCRKTIDLLNCKAQEQHLCTLPLDIIR